MSFAWTRTHKLAILTGALSGFATYFVVDQRQRRAFNSWTTNWLPSECGKWDDNWDHRDPKSLVKPLKGDPADSDAQNQYNEKLQKLKPKAVRHIIMIRHGQYYLNGKTDAERVLTTMGKEQANFTGERLKSLTIPWDLMIQSTMTRAQQTGEIIAKGIGQNMQVEHCALIEEGAPIPPEPAVGHWRPEPQVRIFKNRSMRLINTKNFYSSFSKTVLVSRQRSVVTSIERIPNNKSIATR